MGYIGTQPTNPLLDGSVTAAKLDGGIGTPILLATATASASATLDFDSGIDFTAYSKYQVHLINLRPATTDSYLVCRVSTNGGSTYDSGASDYIYANTITNASSASAIIVRSTGAAWGVIGDSGANQSVSSNSVTGMHGILEFNNPNDAGKRFIVGGAYHYREENGYNVSGLCSFIRNVSQDTDGIQFLFDSGNIADGVIKLYGLQ